MPGDKFKIVTPAMLRLRMVMMTVVIHGMMDNGYAYDVADDDC